MHDSANPPTDEARIIDRLRAYCGDERGMTRGTWIPREDCAALLALAEEAIGARGVVVAMDDLRCRVAEKGSDPFTREAVELLESLVLLVDGIPCPLTAEHRAAVARLREGIGDLGACRMREHERETRRSLRMDWEYGD